MSDKLRTAKLIKEFGDKPFASNQLYQFYSEEEPDLKETTFRWQVYHLKKEQVIQNDPDDSPCLIINCDASNAVNLMTLPFGVVFFYFLDYNKSNCKNKKGYEDD
ncbi:MULTISPECIES: hypothetical protein [Acetobacterium]|uniref:Uncharacterized protein n=1 Tax=Acetobacterium wieringae TaxID=52694 RepID=A0A1F2PNA9_9FIRM|nr:MULTISPECIES: hypothetical protein [Acetobacterium]OFV72304.1 hypothetical protein ACWI_02150 [Acetobacterium wieringae]